MKGKQMSAILAILLMLSGIVAFVPRAFAAATADSLQANPATVNYTYPAQGPGTIFTVNVDVTNVQQLFAFQVGFYFDKNYLQVNSVAEGGFLSSGGAILSFPGTIDNVNGVVTSYGYTLQDTANAVTGSGHLLTVVMEIKPTLFPPVIPAGTAMMTFTETDLDPAQTKLIWNDAVTIITIGTITNGVISLTATPAPPVPHFTVGPAPPNYVGDLLTFDGSSSTPGWNGYANVAIVNYQWDFGDGNITNTAGPTVTHSYSAPGGYLVTLTVTDADGRVGGPSAPTQINILVRPTGCVLDVYTQGWRYIDPFTYTGVLQGKGPNLPAEMFRPGDLVQLFANTIYNGDPVAYQYVAYQVLDAAGNTVLTGNGLSDAGGLAEIDFRIPWPQDVNNPTPIFGTWTAIVTWEIGSSSGLPPYAVTQNDTVTFNVGWGVWSSDLLTSAASYFKGDTVTVTYKVHNDYGIPINVLTTVVLYDGLMVPIGMASIEQMFLPGVTDVSQSVVIPIWAFVGVGTVKANEYSTWPSANGIAFGPEQLASFGINHTFNPTDP